jgi:hypothetical protein
LARLNVLEACIETLTAENEILRHRLEFMKRRLADAETRAAQETAKARWRSRSFRLSVGGSGNAPKLTAADQRAVREGAKAIKANRSLCVPVGAPLLRARGYLLRA